MRGSARIALVVFAWLVIVPLAAYPQASITGVVKDTSGAVLPGVTVEAASPVLIERMRTVLTSETGQYRIENLKPGSYTVTFDDPGAYARPFTVTFTAKLSEPGGELMENICQENNQFGPAGGYTNPYVGKP